ncbi:transcriptional regulator [Mergibacter septicus]|uniref:Transcriptional regulator n=1 Tax=Mergibacter septicus TaxID=221402 RepID=A0A8E3SAG9_9PAST|nr:BolA/IbaG family iron-sulfur metabolism protein [Mergibacter septicus]AWX16096.1 transcriptional regulator [Mergibacter septicus]QDJ13550.1 transcriptional regulator [Mergibacter septicus]QDJ15349.1 transcriptional regulator [Mergibacter septicus]UTU48782.1 BolA family transcriptional regulator [Mergibacter septicus]WMR95587.1 BolA/IbaG family iron-sulfur metabolism protein [Mergibacter septicus]
MNSNKKKYLVELLTKHLNPFYLDVINESHLHASNKGNNSHFKLIIVSEKFKGMQLIQRHRLIYQLLSEELSTFIHALALHLYTLEEWKACNEKAPLSPNCGGVGK